jgi:hypothetical protein
MFRSVSISTGSVGSVNTENADESGLDDALVSRLTLIEDQPLESRAAAYAQLHDQLRDRLEGGDQPRSSNG